MGTEGHSTGLRSVSVCAAREGAGRLCPGQLRLELSPCAGKLQGDKQHFGSRGAPAQPGPAAGELDQLSPHLLPCQGRREAVARACALSMGKALRPSSETSPHQVPRQGGPTATREASGCYQFPQGNREQQSALGRTGLAWGREGFSPVLQGTRPGGSEPGGEGRYSQSQGQVGSGRKGEARGLSWK